MSVIILFPSQIGLNCRSQAGYQPLSRGLGDSEFSGLGDSESRSLRLLPGLELTDSLSHMYIFIYEDYRA